MPDLHSNMDRLKREKIVFEPEWYIANLHSNMDRLKLLVLTTQARSLEYLHSNMDRLKQYPERANIPNNNSSFY